MRAYENHASHTNKNIQAYGEVVVVTIVGWLLLVAYLMLTPGASWSSSFANGCRLPATLFVGRHCRLQGEPSDRDAYRYYYDIIPI